MTEEALHRSIGVAHSIAEEPLEGIEVASVPGHFDGVCGLISPQGGIPKAVRTGWILR